MKEASGELNMTVVTIVAIAAVGAFFYAFVWPSIQKGIALNTCKNSRSSDDSFAQSELTDCPVEDIVVTKDSDGSWKCSCGRG